MLLITGLGMITAVGRDCVSSCASMRAGISRTRDIPSFTSLDLDEQEPVSVQGCAVHGITEGFQRLGVWIRLAAAALSDLLLTSGLRGHKAGFWDQTAVLAVTPVHDEQRFEDMDWSGESITRQYILPVGRVCGISFRRDLIEVVSSGHAGAAVALQRGMELMRQGIRRVLVIAADSYLDPYSLDWLANSGRLKTPDNPAGLIPGEAGACFLCEPGGALTTNARAVVHRVQTAVEPDHYSVGRRSQGECLASVISSALNENGDESAGADLMADLNGEEWRAYELACARVRLRRRLEGFRISYPAISFGETGAVSGLAAICAATRALERGYALGGQVLITSSSDHGHVGAMYVTS